MPEWVGIKATLAAIDNDQFQCAKCLIARPEPQNTKMRELKGCFESRSSPVLLLNEKPLVKFYSCPGNYFDYAVVKYLEMQNQYELGVLPFPGSMSEQPYKIIELFDIIKRYKDEKRLEAHKKQASKMKAARGKRIG